VLVSTAPEPTPEPTAVVRPVAERTWLDERSWVDVARSWLPEADELYEVLAQRAPWRQGTVWRYDHSWDEPRLSAWIRPGPSAPHPLVTQVHKELRHAYGVALDGVSLCWYRDGSDAMAPHRDDDLRWCENTVIAILTLGAQRPWTLGPRAQRSVVTHDIAPASGDLLVMGGATQMSWVHGVPRVPGLRQGRISLQWRWTSRTGRPVTGGRSGSDRNYGHGR
jgi:alkylated DNA repair dioxygenase AlkB